MTIDSSAHFGRTLGDLGLGLRFRSAPVLTYSSTVEERRAATPSLGARESLAASQACRAGLLASVGVLS
jgi:hypothetical protein